MTQLRSIFVRTALLATATAGLCPAQARFEVASIRPSATPPAFKYEIDDHRIDFGGMSLSSLVTIAFDVPSWRLTSPDRAATTRVDIQATLPPGATRAQVPQMIQGGNGAKLSDAAADNNDRTFVTGRSTLYKFSTPEDNGSWTISGKDGHQIFDAQRITMAELTDILTNQQYLDDPVVDMTGLKGYWQLRSEVPKNNARIRATLAAQGMQLPPQDPDGISLPGELRKLGVDLEHRKAPIDHLVVDHIERQPTEN